MPDWWGGGYCDRVWLRADVANADIVPASVKTWSPNTHASNSQPLVNGLPLAWDLNLTNLHLRNWQSIQTARRAAC